MGLLMEFVPGILSGDRELTEHVAGEIGEALGTSAALWFGLYDDYLAWKSAQGANECVHYS